MSDNTDRIERGEKLQKLHLKLSYSKQQAAIEAKEHSSVTDAIADLLHFAKGRGWDTDIILTSAQGHLEAEQDEDEEEVEAEDEGVGLCVKCATQCNDEALCPNPACDQNTLEAVAELLDLARDDQRTYLDVGSYESDYGSEWPEVARAKAARFRAAEQFLKARNINDTSFGELAASFEEAAAGYEEEHS